MMEMHDDFPEHMDIALYYYVFSLHAHVGRGKITVDTYLPVSKGVRRC
jgi:hypothetical protein